MPSQQRIFLTVLKIFAELGIPIAQNKTRGPAMSVEFLGINLDTVKFQVSLLKEKIYRIILDLSTLLDSPNCSERKLPSLHNSARLPFHLTSSFFFFFFVCVLEDQISLTNLCHDELHLWITFLKQWNGLSFFYNNLVSLSLQLFTNAAPSIGFRGFYQGLWFVSMWLPQFLDTRQFPALNFILSS